MIYTCFSPSTNLACFLQTHITCGEHERQPVPGQSSALPVADATPAPAGAPWMHQGGLATPVCWAAMTHQTDRSHRPSAPPADPWRPSCWSPLAAPKEGEGFCQLQPACGALQVALAEIGVVTQTGRCSVKWSAVIDRLASHKRESQCRCALLDACATWLLCLVGYLRLAGKSMDCYCPSLYAQHLYILSAHVPMNSSAFPLLAAPVCLIGILVFQYVYY